MTLLAMRGEESAWFSAHHLGSRIALGQLPAAVLDTARRFDTKRTLADHLAECGADIEAIRRSERSVDPERTAAFLELHIEQGPLLVAEDIPVGIVSGLRGNMRVRSGRCIGEYTHSGAAPRSVRRDCVMAMAELVGRAEAEWERLDRAGRDLVLTFGKLYTDAAQHSHNKVPGEMFFAIDARSHEKETLADLQIFLERTASEISSRRKVEIELGQIGRVAPVPMSPAIRAAMRESAGRLGIHAREMASGGGHDAGEFAILGVPTGMVFVRNSNGSHNPYEAMSMDDFAAGVRLLASTMVGLAIV
jgi:N-carbamoyl-L-amino-acid hydrolase